MDISAFKLWSETNVSAKKNLLPDLGLRNWDSLSQDEKNKIWRHLVIYFFDESPKENFRNPFCNERGDYYPFYGYEQYQKIRREVTILSIMSLNDRYKVQGFAANYLKAPTSFNACTDFYAIFMDESGDVVLELLSLYIKIAYKEYSEYGNHEGAKTNFKQLRTDINDTFKQFGLNIYLSSRGFVPRQDEKITEKIYEPVLAILSDHKWKKVNQHLSDAFADYHKNTPQGHSSCITKTVSAVQAYLQILILGKTGKGSISELIQQAQTKKLIPNDFLTTNIFENIESTFMKARQEMGDAHPKEVYADDKNSLLILNLAMVFFQHCFNAN